MSVAIVPGAWVSQQKARIDEAGRDGVDRGRVAGDDAAGLELLDPLVGGRAADADLGAEVGVRPPAIPLEDLEDPQLGGADLGTTRPSGTTSLG